MRMRKELHPGLFALVLLFEFTSAHIDMFALYSLSVPTYIYGFFWLPFSILTSVMLTGSLLWRYYLILDNLTLLGLLSLFSIYFMNDSPLYWMGYAIFVFFTNGNFRIILNVMKWSSPMVVIYKLIKIYVVSFFFIDKFAVLYSVWYIGNAPTLWSIGNLLAGGMFVVFTTLYRSCFVFAMSSQDGTLNAEWNYQIGESDNIQTQADPNKSKIELTIS